MKVLKRCRFAIKDSKKFDILAKTLVEFNDSLLKMCSERAAEVSQQSTSLRILCFAAGCLIPHNDMYRQCGGHLLARRLEGHLPQFDVFSL